MIELSQLTRIYQGEGAGLTALDALDLTIQSGEFVAITGPSGSGKSTLLGLMAGLDRPSSGTVTIDGTEITSLSEDNLSKFRARKLGFVFQNFLLVPTLTAIENVQLPADIVGDKAGAERARELLASVGLADRSRHYPSQLSGGEMQRVAVARAFVNKPPILFADEPTGNLDSKNGDVVIDLLLALNRRENSTLVLITHNPDLARLADREVRLRDGRITEIQSWKNKAAKAPRGAVRKSAAQAKTAVQKRRATPALSRAKRG